MTKSELLRAARAKIEKPEHWAQGFYAYRPAVAGDLEGPMAKTTTNDPLATCWCVRGAVCAVDGVGSGSEYLTAALREVTKASPQMLLDLASVARFNDAPHRTHGEVLNLMDVAIRLAEADEAAAEHVIH